jgi:hypothetical protein
MAPHLNVASKMMRCLKPPKTAYYISRTYRDLAWHFDNLQVDDFKQGRRLPSDERIRMYVNVERRVRLVGQIFADGPKHVPIANQRAY